jgi:hypothetical protein
MIEKWRAPSIIRKAMRGSLVDHRKAHLVAGRWPRRRREYLEARLVGEPMGWNVSAMERV